MVANCHELPTAAFTRRRLTVSEIVAVWKPILERYKEKHFIFTVSPIRHIKDGLHENQLSKGILMASVEELIRQDPPQPSLQREGVEEIPSSIDTNLPPSLSGVPASNAQWGALVGGVGGGLEHDYRSSRNGLCGVVDGNPLGATP